MRVFNLVLLVAAVLVAVLLGAAGADRTRARQANLRAIRAATTFSKAANILTGARAVGTAFSPRSTAVAETPTFSTVASRSPLSLGSSDRGGRNGIDALDMDDSGAGVVPYRGVGRRSAEDSEDRDNNNNNNKEDKNRDWLGLGDLLTCVKQFQKLQPGQVMIGVTQYEDAILQLCLFNPFCRVVKNLNGRAQVLNVMTVPGLKISGKVEIPTPSFCTSTSHIEGCLNRPSGKEILRCFTSEAVAYIKSEARDQVRKNLCGDAQASEMECLGKKVTEGLAELNREYTDQKERLLQGIEKMKADAAKIKQRVVDAVTDTASVLKDHVQSTFTGQKIDAYMKDPLYAKEY